MMSNSHLQTEPGTRSSDFSPKQHAIPFAAQQPGITPRGLEILHVLNDVFDTNDSFEKDAFGNEAFDGSGPETVAESLT